MSAAKSLIGQCPTVLVSKMILLRHWTIATLVHTLVIHLLLLYRRSLAFEKRESKLGFNQPSLNFYTPQNPENSQKAGEPMLKEQQRHDCEAFGLSRMNPTLPPLPPARPPSKTTATTSVRFPWGSPPCFSGNVKTRLVAYEGDSVEFACFVYNVNFKKNLVSNLFFGQTQK